MQKLIEALKAKLAAAEAELMKDVSTPEGRAALEKHLAELLGEVGPLVATVNPGAAAALATAAAGLNKVAAVETATGI